MPFVKGQPKPEAGGRKKGSKNKRTRDAEEFAAALLDDPKYLVSLKYRLLKGTAPHMETLLCHYRYGKPVDRKSVGFEDADGNPALFPTLKLILKDGNRTARKTE